MSESAAPHAPVRSGSPTGPAEPPLLPVRRWFFAARERWISVFCLIAIICGGVGWFLSTRPKIYSATATMLVERSNDRVVDIKQVVDNTVDSSLSDALLLTHSQQIRSASFLRRVVASFSPSERKDLLAPYRDVPGVGDRKSLVVDDGSELLDLIGRNLRVERVPRTLLIGVAVRHQNPLMAQFLANRLVDQYIQYLIDRSSASNDSALIFLRKEAEELRSKVEEAEHSAQAYRERNNLIFLEQNQNTTVERVRALSSALTQARVERLALDARLHQVESVMKSEDVPRELNSLPEFTGFAAVQRQLDDNRAARDVLAKRYGPLHPKMTENASLRTSLEIQRREQLGSALADLRNQRDKAVTQETQLAKELTVAEQESLHRDQLTVDYNVLQRSVTTMRETYAQILSRLNETTISSRLQNTNIKFFDRAGVPNLPVEPNPLTIAVILAALAGVILIGYPLLADVLDNRMRSSSDVENFLDSELIGILPTTRGILPADRARVVSKSLHDEAVEAFRGLYSHIQFLSGGNATRTILLTSTIPGEGKSFVACNLAGSFAAHGHRTLLIDADFRRPSLHRAFGLDNKLGLLNWLKSTSPLDSSLPPDAKLGLVEIVEGLTLLRSGGESRQVTELLGQPRMTALMTDLKSRFDVVIIDSSPAGVFPDADACARFANELLYICRFKGADRAHVRQTLDRLRQRQTKYLGVVYNGIPSGGLGEYYLPARARGRRHYEEYHRGLA